MYQLEEYHAVPILCLLQYLLCSVNDICWSTKFKPVKEYRHTQKVLAIKCPLIPLLLKSFLSFSLPLYFNSWFSKPTSTLWSAWEERYMHSGPLSHYLSYMHIYGAHDFDGNCSLDFSMRLLEERRNLPLLPSSFTDITGSIL